MNADAKSPRTAHAFVTTQWTRVLQARGPSDEDRAALALLKWLNETCKHEGGYDDEDYSLTWWKPGQNWMVTKHVGIEPEEPWHHPEPVYAVLMACISRLEETKQ